VFIDWINYYIIAKHNGIAPIKLHDYRQHDHASG